MQSFPKTLSKTLQQLSITCIWQLLVHFGGFPGGSDSEESACNVGDLGSIPGLGNPLEKGKASHSSILAWRIQELQRIRHE